MITLTWYNIVAIVAGFIFLWKLSKLDIGDRYGLDGIVIGLWLSCIILFYSIWGGIFWW